MYTIQKTIGKIFIKELSPMKVASHRIISTSPKSDAIEYMRDLIQRGNLNFNDLRKFGIKIPVSEIQQNMGLRGYEFWVCLPDDVNCLGGETIINIPISNYAVMRIKNPFDGPLDKISNGWLELHEWIKTTGFKTALHNPDRHMLEELIKVDGVTYMDLVIRYLSMNIQIKT
jgi:AraC family transcriptional regulator